ncbi:hypothetical protein R6Q57_025553 [Mikania cordata]
MNPSKMITLCIMLVFIYGMMKFPQLSLADDYPHCRSVKDCYPDECPIISIPLCIKHKCVCIRKDELRPTPANNS